MNIGNAPLKESIVIPDTLTASKTWWDWFNSVGLMLGSKRNQQNVSWDPTFSGLTFSSSGTVTGTYTQKDNFVLINVTITPASGSTTSVLDTTKITNLPKKSQGVWSGHAFQNTGKVDLGTFYIKDATNELYTPSWSTIMGVINLTGIYVTSD
jgi:hypothetical protein